MRPSRAALLIMTVGLLTFGIVFTLLQVTRSEAAPGQVTVVAPPPTITPIIRDNNSAAAKLAAGALAVGVPISGSELLLRDVQSGDRLDVLASLPAPDDGRPVTAVVVRGATVLEPVTPNSPLLLQVSADDAMVLVHLVSSGTHLGYIVWSANGGSPAPTQPLDERTARLLLGLAPTAAAASPQVVPTAASTATPTPPSLAEPRFGGFLYAVQEGDTWESIAALFGLSVAELKHWNETSADLDLAPRTLLFIPR